MKSNRAAGNKEDARTLNALIEVMQNKTYQARTKLIEQGKPVTAIGIKDILTGKEERKRRLLLIFQDHNKNVRRWLRRKGMTCVYREKHMPCLRFLLRSPILL